MAKVIVLSPVDHDGKRYDEGEAIEKLTEAAAKALVDAGVAIVPGGKAAPKGDGADAGA